MTQDERENPGLMVIEGSVSASTTLVAGTPAEDRNGLSERAWAFIDAYIERQGKDLEGAAIAAGYSPGGAKNMATRNLLNPKVQDEIARRVKLGKGTALLAAFTRGMDIIENSEDDRAATAMVLGFFDRFGLAAPKGPLIDARTVNNISGPAASAVLQQVAERAARRLGRTDGE